MSSRPPGDREHALAIEAQVARTRDAHCARRARRIRRELIRARTGGGRKRIKERGVRFGRPLKLNAYQRWEALARREAGETLMDIARSCGISHPAIMRL